MVASGCPRTGRFGGAAALSLLATAQFVVAADFTVVFVAMPVIGRDLPLGQQDLQWVMTAYGLPFGGFLLLAGRTSDLIGRRVVFVTGHLVFGGSSAVAAAASSPAVLLTARAVQGVGAAMLVPATLALLHAVFPAGPARNRALGLWGAAGATGGAVGVVAGGVLTSGFGWPAIFLVNIPLSLLSVLGARRWLPPDPPGRPVRGADVLGAAWLTGAGMLLVLGIGRWAGAGDRSTALLAGAGAGGCLACFVAYERRSSDPLLPSRLLRRPALIVAAALTALFYASLNNQLYLLTTGLQDVSGRSAAGSGLVIVPYSLAIAVGTAVGARLTDRRGARTAAVGGMGAGVVGVLVLVAGVRAGMEIDRTVLGLVVSGLGQGVAWTGIWAAVTSAAEEPEQGVVSGAVTAMGQLGQAVGLVALAAVLARTGPTAGDVEPAVTAAGVGTALLVLSGGVLAGVLAAMALPRAVGASAGPADIERR